MLTPRFMNLHRYIDHDWQMTPINLQVTKSKVKFTPSTSAVHDIQVTLYTSHPPVQSMIYKLLSTPAIHHYSLHQPSTSADHDIQVTLYTSHPPVQSMIYKLLSTPAIHQCSP
ncbi:hypothetical protein DPMN_080725 [Dreissena polymorpha]|uniref:Uncharacterized protein n=1 Tax=Dreissena polymorpha TaxID=45954 RepID=A0A9D4BRZ8_DREPO|nr:hypothetical protein DPMN_080725 [Dreissena polymorpha]